MSARGYVRSLRGTLNLDLVGGKGLGVGARVKPGARGRDSRDAFVMLELTESLNFFTKLNVLGLLS